VYEVRKPLEAFWGSSELGPLVSPLLVPDAALFQALASALPGSQPLYSWTLSIDPRRVRQDAAGRLSEGLTAFTAQATRLLPNATVEQAISAGLASFAAGFPLLVALLYALAAPALLVVLAYTVIVNALVLEQHRSEIVLLRGRGASHGHVAVSYLADGVLIAALAVAGGPWLAVPLAQAIGQTSGFLAFAAGRPFTVGVDSATFATAAAAGLLGLAAGLLPLASTARLRTAALAAQRSRGRGRPGWQRRWVDAILLAIGVYTAIVLARRGTVTVSHEQDVLLEDPLIALGPLACLAGGTLLSVRLLPLLSSVLARTVVARAVSVGLGLRRIACEPLDYTRLAGLLTLILSTGAFAAAVAGTVAGNLADQARYAAGSPLRVIEYDPRTRVDAALPAQWHRRLPGVIAASPALRVQPDQATVSAGATGVPVEVLGIDPRTLGQVMWFRPDFATQSRDTLLRLLSATRPRVLASQGLLESLHVEQGDTVTLSLQGQADVPVSIVGIVRYFPTLDPVTGPFVVANLAFLQRTAGAVAPSEEWLRPSDGGAGPATASILAALRRAGRIVVDFEATPPPLSLVAQPLQVGLFGIVSAGLLIGAALCLAGLIAETFFSLRRRSREFGVLRALGGTPGAVSLTLLVERTIVVVMATLSALVIGLLTARLFIPYLPVVTSATPPFLVTIAWSDVVHLLMVVAAAFLATLAATLWIVRHLEIHRTIRLGD
jgi:putative ABC transport system permease protein